MKEMKWVGKVAHVGEIRNAYKSSSETVKRDPDIKGRIILTVC
jgi:hypothetical protein